MAGKAINQYNTFSGSASDVNVLVQETSQTDPNTYEHKKAKLDTIIATLKNIANGLAGLDGQGLIPESLLPAKYDDVVEGYYYNGVFYTTSAHTTAMTATTGRIYIDLGGTGNLYRYTGSAYVQVTDNDLRDDVEEDVASIGATLNQHDSRIKNLEQKAGDYSIVQYRGTNAVPTGKAKYGLVRNIVGKSRAWNQLVDGDTTEHSAVMSASYANITAFDFGVNKIAGHKYLISAEVKASASKSLEIGFTDNTYETQVYGFTATSSYQTVFAILPATASYGAYAFVRNNYDADSSITAYAKKLLARDLTLIFGSGNEPSTVAEALAQLPALGQYNAYDAGSLVDTEVSGVKSVGVNIWDEQPQIGSLWSDGTNNNNVTNALRSDYIPVLRSTSYYIKSTNGYAVYVRFYDVNKTAIGSTWNYQNIKNTSFTTSADTVYIRFILLSDYGTTYNHDIQICLNSYPQKTVYHPYSSDSISLSEPVTLRSAGSVSEVLTLETGKKTRPIGSYTFTGNETGYTSNSVGRVYWYSGEIASIIKIPSSRNDKPNALCAGWISIDDNHLESNSMQISVGTSGLIGFCLTKTNDSGSVADLKTYLQNHTTTIYFELATPLSDEQVCDPVPYNFLEIEGGGTVETIQTQSPVIDNCLDVGYLAI